MTLIIRIIKKYLPWIPYVYHYGMALVDHNSPTKNKYSQHGEDIIISDLLANRNLERSIYVDIGANHPTRISNTYLLYRKGVNGIVIEPNGNFRPLYSKFRPRDVFIQVGCGSKPDLLQYYRIGGSVNHTFYTENPNGNIKLLPGITEYLPILPLDMIVNSVCIPREWICLLSVDTEGFDVEVIKGAGSILQKVYLVCIEANQEATAKELSYLLERKKFKQIAKTGCNIIFENKGLFHQNT